MTATELILICALLAWAAFAFGIAVLLEVAVSRTRISRIRALRSQAGSERWRELVPPEGWTR